MITFVWFMFIVYALSLVLRLIAFASGVDVYDEPWKEITAILVTLALTLWTGMLVL